MSEAHSQPENAAVCEAETRYLDALYRLSGMISAVNRLGELLELIMAESKSLMRAEGSSLLLYDPERNDLFFEVALGEAGERIKPVRLAMGEGVAGLCAQKREIVISENAATDPRHSKKADDKTAFTTRNLIAAPMIGRNETLIGVLEVVNTVGREHFSGEDAKILQIFARQAGLAIENARLIEKNLQNERLAALGVAIAGIAHYIKNVLTGIEGSVSLIRTGIQMGNQEMIAESFPIFERSKSRIVTLIKDMLAFSKAQTLEIAPEDLNTIVREIVEECAASATDHKVELDCELDPALPPLLLDRMAIADAVLNLVTNALDACSNHRGSRVMIRTRLMQNRGEKSAGTAGGGNANACAGTNADAAVIEVIDDGPGIPDHILGHIFEPFFTTKGSKGTGLGLSVVRKVIEDHKGTVCLHSSPEHGTIFQIRLPVSNT